MKDLRAERIMEQKNVADALTKALGPKNFKYFMEKIGFVNVEANLETDIMDKS